MEYDIFFSISQTPDHEGYTPSEEEMFRNYFEQVECADRLGFGVAWIAQAHLSTQLKHNNRMTNQLYLTGREKLDYALTFHN